MSTRRSLIKPKHRRALTFVLILGMIANSSLSQVILRDSTITWQHHQFELNTDGSMKKPYPTVDSDIVEEVFTGAKVIENELIRLVVIPEYGGRVLSFLYKPTNHEYLYQSEVGSPYGIDEHNFYYEWLMVYGGIFPTFPEPEHGKTWFLPWDYSIIKNNQDTVIIRMEYQDNTSYSGAPGGFNNGITNITCQIDISVFRNSTIWNYDVALINDKANSVNYEYWTCTTLAPGSEIGNTGTPLNSEIIIPVEEYIAAWSPGAWIGNYNGTYDMANINYLNEWDDMGIAYAANLNDIYWGVINHDNDEGIFRISENVETKGMKLWTWGKNNVDNNLYDFSNGGADNYIELWAGVSNAFFEDAVLPANTEKSWTESYCATVGMSAISNINREAAVNIIWHEENMNLSYELNTFNASSTYGLEMYLVESSEEIINRSISFSNTGTTESFSLADMGLSLGDHTLNISLYDDQENLVLEANKIISVSTITGISSNFEDDNSMLIRSLGNNDIQIVLPQSGDYLVKVLGLNGQMIMQKETRGNESYVHLPANGLYIINVLGRNAVYSKKIFLQ